MYLFSINTVFIGLSTYVVCKMLKFPMVKYANQKKRRRTSIIATVVGVLVLAPSVYLFIQLYQTEVQKSAIEEFMNDYIQFEGTRTTSEYNPLTKELDIVLFGAIVPDEVLNQWKSKFESTEDLIGVTPIFYQGSKPNDNGMFGNIAGIQEDRINDIKSLQNQREKISELEKELTLIKDGNKKIQNISEEAYLLYPELKKISYAPNISVTLDTKKMDTVDVFTVSYHDSIIDTKGRIKTNGRLKQWLKYRIKSDSVMVQTAQASITEN